MTDRIDGIIDRVSDAEEYEKASWLLGNGVLTNFAVSVIYNTIKANVDFQGKAGLPAKVVRKSNGYCCKWCQSLVGTYNYPDVPDDVYRRHDNCNCTVEFYPGDGRKQNVHNKEWYQATPEELAERKAFAGIESAPKGLIFTPAETIEEAEEYTKGVLGLGTSDYKVINIDVANMINEEVTRFYNTFGNLHEMGVLDEIRIVPGKQNYIAAYNPAYKSMIFPSGKVRYKTSINKMKQMAIEQKQYGFWSTSAEQHTIRHELGHAIEKAYLTGNSELDAKLTEIRTTIMDEIGVSRWSMNTPDAQMLEAGDKISYYALRNNGELVAESIAEYMGNDPREVSRRVVEELLP